jgi:hypothetical protein
MAIRSWYSTAVIEHVDGIPIALLLSFLSEFVVNSLE